MNLDFLAIEFLNNQLGDYLLAAAIFVVGILSIKVLKRLGFRNLKKWVAKTQNVYDDVLIKILERNLIPIAYLGTFYLAVNNLSLHSILDRSVEVFVVIVSTILAIRLLTYSIEYLIKIYWLNYHRDNQNIEQSIDALVPAIRVVIWGIGAIFLLDNIGFDISAIVASVGIGGVAIALASQGLLQDLFSYFAILFDRPFELGDFISVGDYVGTIEHVGIKTTRLKSISGEQIIIANTDLTSSRVRNYKRMTQRRIVSKLGVVYETDTEQLAQIPNLITEIINNTENTIFDRAHFSGYGSYSLDFEIVYFINTSDYAIYMDAQQQINLKIKSEFAKRSIEFAYPTQVNYFNNSAIKSNDHNGSPTLVSLREK
ncbi:small-conductance mechanosensitive channel [Xenococcus sp. PCC 7305]|uniref:mechanosensitive ion channel family protein n=1 Tax=Xenococcus sp. PCC 7305 TaxID=102125 RepID=UPI0002AC443D|nr:mechanosensitive ion channel family protein [Xenococcus sp. PCC 7305]ELS04101.1 small-conductance mechanosensitive channel [Xenococcus sp. PCC 7305]